MFIWCSFTGICCWVINIVALAVHQYLHTFEHFIQWESNYLSSALSRWIPHFAHMPVLFCFFFLFFFVFLSRVSAWTLSLQISSRTVVSLQLNVIVFFSVFLWKVMLVGQLLLRACLYQSSCFFGYFVQGGEGHDTQHILLFLRLHPSSYIFVQATNPYNILC